MQTSLPEQTTFSELSLEEQFLIRLTRRQAHINTVILECRVDLQLIRENWSGLIPSGADGALELIKVKLGNLLREATSDDSQREIGGLLSSHVQPTELEQ